jgi:hypothetical protein
MEKKENAEGWVYVVICDPEKDEHFLGLYDKERDIDFIPAFQTKDAANDCFLTLPREAGKKYEIQAIHIDELTESAEKNGFIVAMVGSDGHIVK